MIPALFPQANRTFIGGPDRPEVGDLPVHDTGEGLVSCWRASWRERLAILLTGRVWLHVLGRGTPPVLVEGVSPFREAA